MDLVYTLAWLCSCGTFGFVILFIYLMPLLIIFICLGQHTLAHIWLSLGLSNNETQAQYTLHPHGFLLGYQTMRPLASLCLIMHVVCLSISFLWFGFIKFDFYQLGHFTCYTSPQSLSKDHKSLGHLMELASVTLEFQPPNKHEYPSGLQISSADLSHLTHSHKHLWEPASTTCQSLTRLGCHEP